MQQYDITVPANAPFRVGAAGRYIKYVAGSNGGGDVSLSVTPGMQAGNKIRLQPGQAYRVADDQPIPDSWAFANAAGGAPILGTIVIGNGRIDDSTVSGTVQVLDGGKSRTMNGTAFSMYGNASAVAGQNGRVQLWNPAGNPNRLVIETVTILGAASTGTVGLVQWLNAALANLVGYGIAKKNGGAASLAAVYSDTTATNASPGVSLMGMGAPANGTQGYKLSEPIVLAPGQGLVFWVTGNNTFIGVTFEWYEEPNV